MDKGNINTTSLENIETKFVDKKKDLELKLSPKLNDGVKSFPSYIWTNDDEKTILDYQLNLEKKNYKSGTFDGNNFDKHQETIVSNKTISLISNKDRITKNLCDNFESNLKEIDDEKIINHTDMIMNLAEKISKEPINTNAVNKVINDIEAYNVVKLSEDVVNKPKHYNTDVFPQVIDMMLKMFSLDEVKAFCKLNSFKYRMRAGIKDSQKIEEDIKKAMWYENKFKEISSEEKQILKG